MVTNQDCLLISDTDSLMYEIKTEDVDEDFNKNKEIFDFSNYSAQNIILIQKFSCC